MEIDFGRTADDYARHRAGFPAELFRRLGALGVGMPGQRVLDLGTGTGTLGRGFAQAGCLVTGLDRSESLLRQAIRLDGHASIHTRYIAATAEAPAFRDRSFDVVSAGQCWHWFDRPRAASEARRLLASGGTLVIAHFDWLPLPGTVVEATETLILEVNPAWRGARGTGLYPAWLADVRQAGFTFVETFSFDVDTIYSHEAWRGRVRASAGIAASLPAEEVARFDDRLGQLLSERFPSDPLAVPHRVFAVVSRAP